MTLQWVAVDARTGLVLADLPDLAVDTIKDTIGRLETTTAALPVATAPSVWLAATKPAATCLVLLDDAGDGTQAAPVWGAMVTQRRRGSNDTAALSLTTIPGYLDRRYIGDSTYTATGQNDIVASLLATFAADNAPSGLPGIPITTQALPGANPARDRTFADADDKTVYAALQDLMGVIDGPEWTVRWQWLHNPERLVPVLHVGERVGAAPVDGLAPAAWFDSPGCVTDAELVEDYGAGKGANRVIAYSTAQGTTRPQSPPQTATDGRPTFELRFSPSTSISDVDTLTAHAQDALAIVAEGSNALALTADLSSAPRLGSLWNLGDDVGYSLTGPGFPDTLTGVGRAIGWEMTLPTASTPGTVSPILAVTELEGA